jgi:hypothetical protein
MLGRDEEGQTVTNNGDNIPADQGPATNDPASQSITDNIIAEASNTSASTAINQRTGKWASQKKAPQMVAPILILWANSSKTLFS